MAISYVGAGAVTNGVNPTVTVPAGVVQGDILLIITTSNNGNPTPPAGWTSGGVKGTSMYISVYYKFAGATESSVVLTLAGVNSRAVMVAYRGANVLSGFVTTTLLSNTSITSAALTTLYDEQFVVNIFSSNSSTGAWTAPASTTTRITASATSSICGLLIVDGLQAAPGSYPARTATITIPSRELSSATFTLIPLGVTKYWVGGTGTWDTTSTTNWSSSSGGAAGASPPGINDSVIFDQAGTYTVTMTGALTCGSMTVSAGTVTFATGTTPTLAVSVSMTLVAGTVWTNTGALSFTAQTPRTITTNGVTINSPITFIGTDGIAGTWTLGSALTTGTTVTTTLTGGALALNGFDLTTGIFASTGTATRSIQFGSNNIVLSSATPATTVLSFATATGFTYTGTGGFTSDAAVTKTYVFGTTGGTSANSPNLSLTGSGTAVQTFTTGSWFGSLNFGTTAFNPGTTTLNVNALTLSSGGTFSTLTATMVASGTITSNTNTTLGALTITTGTTTLGDTFTMSPTSTFTLTTGTLALNGFNLTTGIFSSSNTNTRSITFGSNNIVLAHTTAAQTVLNMTTATSFTYTGTGGFTSDASVTRTYVFGTTGGSSANAPNLSIASGAAVPTFTTGSWFNLLDFTGSSTTPAASVINVDSINLSTGGTYNSLGITMISTGTITPNGKTVAALTVNNGAGTVTLAGALGCTTYTQTAGTIDFATFNLTCSASATYAAGTLNNIGTISCTTWAETGTFNLSQGTISASTSFTVTSGAFTYSVGGTLSTPAFVHTAGTVALNQALTLATSYTLTAGTLTLGSNLTTGSFIATGTATRAIAFSTNQILLTGNNATIWDGGGAGISYTGTVTIVSNYTGSVGTRTINVGTGWTEATAFDVKAASTVGISIGTSGTDTVAIAGNLDTLDLSGMQFTFSQGVMTAYVDYIIPSTGGTIASSANTLTLASTNATPRNITTNGRTLDFPITISGVGGTFQLTTALVQGLTRTFTLTSGTLNLNGFDLTTGIFSSSAATTRSIIFGTNNIVLAHTTAGQTVLNMFDATGFTLSGTGGFTATAAVTRTFVFGSTAGSATNAPNLTFTGSGTAVQTFSTSNWFNKLDFGTTAFNIGTISLNLNGFTLSSGGTFTLFAPNMRGTGTITPNGKTIAAFTVNNGAGTVTLAGTLGVTTYTQTAGTIDFATFNLSGSGAASYAAGTLNNIGTITCTSWTVTGAFTFGQGTITPSTSFVLTSGSFTYNSGATLSPVPTFTHTAGTVTLNQAYALTTTGTYTLVAGTLTLGANLTTGSFITTGTGVRSIAFSTNQITLTGNNATIWDGGGANITYTGTVTIVSNYSGSVGTRTINMGTGWTESTAFDLKCGSCVGISLGTSGTDTILPAGNVKTIDFTGMAFTLSTSTAGMNVYGDFTIPATGGTVSSSSQTPFGFASTSVTARTITFGRSVSYPILFSGSGTFNLGANLVNSGQTITQLAGTIVLNGYDMSTAQFISSNSTTRAINFGSNSITVNGAGTVWTTAIITNLTISGTPVVNVTNATATATTVLPGALPESQSISFNFTAGTYALTFLTTAGYTADNVNFTGFAGTLGATAACTVYGNYTISSGMTVTASANVLTFGATSGTSTITASTKTLPPIAINGIGGTFNISGSLTTSGLFQVLAGTFSTTISNHNITCTQFDSSTNTSTRSISLNGSTVTISGTTGITLDNTNLTFNPGTSQITLTNATSTVISYIGGGTFYNVSCTGGGTVALSTVNTYNNLTLTNGPSAPSVVTVYDTQTINGVFASVSTNATTRLIVQSVTDGVQETISAGSVSLTDVDFQDIYASGATIPWTGTRLGNLGNNTNITFDDGTTKYWSLVAGGNWNAIAWATSSGGTPSANNFPLAQDTCIIQNTGLNTSATITINSNWAIGTLNMSGRTNAMTLAIGVTTPFIFGDWINGSGVTLTGTGTVTFSGRDASQTITGSGVTFTPNIMVNKISQTVQLGSALTMGATSTLTLTSGILSLNGYNLTTGIFSSNNSNTRAIYFGSNNITLSHTTAATTVLSMSNTTGFTYTGAGGFTSGMSVTRTFTCGISAAVSGSLFFGGSNNLTTTPTILPASSDFTVECWVYPTSFAAIYEIFSQYTAATTGRLSLSVAATTGIPTFFIGATSNLVIDSSVALVLNTWAHIAVTRFGNDYVMYINGVSVGTGSSSTAILQIGLMIGALNSSPNSRHFNGYISNLRVVNNVVVYTGNFTVPTSPLTATQPASTNISAITGTQTKLLLNTPNNVYYLTDSSVNNYTINNNGVTSNALTPITVLPAAGTPPNLAITSGASIPTITSSSTFNILDFTGSTCTPAATTVNLNSNLVLASGGTYTSLSVSMNGSGTNTITGNSKTIAALTFTAGTNSIVDTLTCTTFTINGANFSFISGTLNPTTSFTLTTGSFTYGGTATLGATPLFTQTAGDVTLKAYSLTATGTYTFTSGTLTLTGNLTTGIFSSNNGNTRTIFFDVYNIVLSHTTAAQTVLSLGNTTGFNNTGTGGFTSGMSVTRTFTCGTTAAISGSILFNGSSQYLSRAANAAFNLASGDFTIESWVYITSYADSNFLFTVATASETGGTDSFGFGTIVTTGALFLATGATNYFYSTSPVVPLNTWSHIALVRSGTTYTVWLNGSTSDSIVQSLNMTGGGEMRIGRGRSTSANYFHGYISNLRMVKGVAVYTGAFTPSTSPLTATQPAGTNISAITGTQTSLLLNTPNNASFLQDFSTYNFTLTNNGTATSNASTPITTFPAAGVPPSLAINSGASIPTITTNSTFNILDFTGSTCIPAAAVVNVEEGLTLASGGTYTSLSVTSIGTTSITGNSKTIAAFLVYYNGNPTINDTLSCTTLTVNGGYFNLSNTATLTPTTSITITSGTFIYGGTATLASVATFTHTAGTVTFNNAYALTATGTYTLTAGALTLADGVTLTTGIFSSSNTNTRSIAFGNASAGNINLTHTTAATVVLSMAILTGFSYTGPGGFTVADMAVTRTFTCGTTGGTSSIAPNLTFTSGASIATITTGSWFNKLDYGTTSFTQAASTLNVENITLSATGTYTALILNLVGSGTLTYNGKTTAAVTLLAGTPTFAGTVACTTFTVNGPDFNFNSGTLNPSTSFVLTSGNFTYTSPASLGATATFTQTAGNVTLNQAYSLTTTGTYTLVSGNLSLGGTLTTGIFGSSNTNLRSISFGTNNIVLSHTTAAQTVLNMSDQTNFSYTGTGGFTSPMNVTRTFNNGTTGSSISGSVLYNTTNQRLTLAASSAFDLSGGTWTIEFWMNSTATPTVGNSCRIFIFGANNTYTGYNIAYNSDGSLSAGVPRNLITGIITAAGVISLNTWYHVAIVSNAGSAYIYVNGVAVAGPVTITQPTTSSPTLGIGYDTAATVNFQYQGYLSNIRITKGIAVYTGNFIVPLSPLTATQSAGTNISAITGTQTSLLLNTPNNGFFLTDSSTNNFTVTNNGSIAANALTPITVLPAAGQPVNLAINSGASVPTFTTGSIYNILDFTGSSTTPATTSLNIVSALTLSTGGTYTGLTISSTGATTISSGTGTNKTIAALSLNNGSSTTTIDSTGLGVTGAVTMTQGQLLLNGNLSSGSLTCAGSSRSITGINTTYSITGSGTSAWTFSPSGSILFNGTSQYLSLASTPFIFGTGNFTVEAWIYPTAFRSGGSPTSVVLDNWVSGPSGSYTTGAWTFGAGATGQVAFTYATSSTTTTVIAASSAVSLNVWAHIAAVCNSGTITIYVNGAALATGAATVSLGVTGTVGSSVGAQTSLGSTGTRGLWFTGYISNARVVAGVAVYTGAFTVPTGPFNATQTANPFGGSNTSAITGTQTTLLLNTTNYYDYTTDDSTYAYPLTNVNTATYSMTFPTFTTGASGFTCSGFTINMNSASAKTFVGGSGTYPTINQGGAGILSITGTNTFDNMTNTVNGVTVTFPTSTTTTFNNFSLAGAAGSLVTINSSTTSTAATITKSSGIVYGSYLSIRDSNATGGATWYAGPTSTSVSNNTGWIFTQLPIITMGNLTVADGGFVISNDPVLV